MKAIERRFEIMKYLCRYRFAQMSKLAEKFSVSVRTIQRDICELESVFHIPIVVKTGKQEGGVYLVGNYSFDRAYMSNDELQLLEKAKTLVNSNLSIEERNLFENIIKNYSKKVG